MTAKTPEAPRPAQLVRLHCLNALSRGFSGNAAFFYMNAVFVVRVGAKQFSNLFLYSTLLSVACYVFFLFLTDRQSYRSYAVMLVTNIVFAFVFPWFTENPNWIFAFALMCTATDLVSTNISISAVQTSVNPALFNEVYQKVTNLELLARILATILVTASTKYEAPWLFFGCFYVAAIGQFICFRALMRGMNLKEAPVDPRKVWKATNTAFRYMFTNSFMRVTTILVVWSYSSKFLIDYLLYQKTTQHLHGISQVGPFLSAINFSCTVLAFGAQRLFARKMTAKLPLSTLLSILPLLCLVGGSINLLDDALWPIVALNIFYYMSNRALFLPNSRHCLVMVPTSLRKNLTLTLPIFISAFSIMLGMTVSALKEVWLPLHFNIFFIALTVPVLFVLNQFDNRYIRNMWAKFREIEIPENTGALPSLNLAQMPSPPAEEEAATNETVAAEIIEPRRPDVKGYIQKILAVTEKQGDVDFDQEHITISRCLHVYREEKDPETVRAVVEWHREKLFSTSYRDRILALTLIEALGYRCFDASLERFVDDPASGELAGVAQLILKANRELRGLAIADFSFSTGIRFRFLFGKYLRTENERGLEGLRRLVRHPDPHLSRVFIEGLFSSHYKPLREALRDCLAESDGQTIDLEPLISKMLRPDFEESGTAQTFLVELRFGTGYFRSIDNSLSPALLDLAKKSFNIWTAGLIPQDQRVFLNLLFLREWALPDFRERREILASIPDLLTISEDQRLMLAQVHLEQLKTSYQHSVWSRLLVQPASVPSPRRV